MEPSTVLTAVASLLKLYHASAGALKIDGIGDQEFDAVVALADAAAKVLKVTGEPDQELKIVASTRAMVAAAFMKAYRTHWAENADMLLKQRDEAQRAVADVLVVQPDTEDE